MNSARVKFSMKNVKVEANAMLSGRFGAEQMDSLNKNTFVVLVDGMWRRLWKFIQENLENKNGENGVSVLELYCSGK